MGRQVVLKVIRYTVSMDPSLLLQRILPRDIIRS